MRARRYQLIMKVMAKPGAPDLPFAIYKNHLEHLTDDEIENELSKSSTIDHRHSVNGDVDSLCRPYDAGHSSD